MVQPDELLTGEPVLIVILIRWLAGTNISVGWLMVHAARVLPGFRV
jgi:hypothetical protein